MLFMKEVSKQLTQVQQLYVASLPKHFALEIQDTDIVISSECQLIDEEN